MHRFLTCFATAVSLCLCSDASVTTAPSLPTSQAEAGLIFYVSTQGNDAWSGKPPQPNSTATDGPFKTITQARDEVRKLKASGQAAQPVTVYIRDGFYELPEAIVFTPDDSGDAANPVIYAAFPGEHPVLSGGREIKHWTKLSAVASPPQPKGKAPGQRTPAVHSPPTAKAGELWVAQVPEAKAGKWYFHELFVNGDRRARARIPPTGFFKVDGEITAGKPARFKFREADIKPAWAQRGDVEVVGLLNWAEFRLPIKAVDKASRTVTLAGPRQPFSEKDARYWVENAPDALETPGEWYLDRRRGMLYYHPLPGEDMTRADVVAPLLKQLVRFEGDIEAGKFVHDVHLRGLTFAYTDWSMPATGYADMQAAYDIPAAVAGQGVHSSSIEDSVFSHLGGFAVEFGQGSKDNRIAGNETIDLGAGGVKIGDPKDPNDEDQASSGNLVVDNDIHDIGLVYPAAVGIWVGQSSGNTIAHNAIHNTYYTAISVGWTWGYGPTAARDNVIEFNNIHDIGRGMLSDMGCIYTLGVQPGTVERNNVCHDVSRYSYGGWGLYTDEGSSDIVIENNIVYRTEDACFHQHYGRDNIVRNNIFALGQKAELRRTRKETHLSFVFEHNIVYWKDAPLLDGEWSDGQYRFDDDLYFRADGQPIKFGDWSFEEWQQRGQDAHSIVADPSFVDPERGDFSLKPDSPSEKVGFKSIDVTGVGPRRKVGEAR